MIRTLASSLAVFFAFCICVPSQASEPQWEKFDEWNGIQMYRKEVPGTPVLAYMGSGPIQAPMAKVVSIILDTPRRREWMSRIRTSEVVSQASETEKIEYVHLHLPWPVTDRDFVYRFRRLFDPAKKEFTLEFVSVDDPARPEVPGRVRAHVYSGTFRLTPLDGGARTWIEAEAHADPKGLIPKWIVNIYQKKLPRESLEGLLQQVAKPWVGVDPAIESLIKAP